ncbi:hypothetical protein [Kistimonas asteriae]|uniref:hypothetical protein n=1 Tax=Kistimonas asteriae TaxID=517724 RepID=UPI001BA8488A|nr:hypothetical protein [Kistimonas asteriae]
MKLIKTGSVLIVFSALISSTLSYALEDNQIHYSYIPEREQIMPVVTLSHQDNGFIACYSHNDDAPSYPVGGNIHVKGFISMQGRYLGRIFHPAGYLHKDISVQDSAPSQLCKTHIPSCQGSDVECWAGGDTGGYLDILMHSVQ